MIQFYTFLEPRKPCNGESEIAVRLRKWGGSRQKTIVYPVKIFPLRVRSFLRSARDGVFVCGYNSSLARKKKFHTG